MKYILWVEQIRWECVLRGMSDRWTYSHTGWLSYTVQAHCGSSSRPFLPENVYLLEVFLIFAGEWLFISSINNSSLLQEDIDNVKFIIQVKPISSNSFDWNTWHSQAANRQISKEGKKKYIEEENNSAYKNLLYHNFVLDFQPSNSEVVLPVFYTLISRHTG